MARLTPADAARHVRYIEREEAAGRLTDNLRGIREHRLAFLRRSKCCLMCGHPLTDPVSVERGFGPDCAQRLAVAS